LWVEYDSTKINDHSLKILQGNVIEKEKEIKEQEIESEKITVSLRDTETKIQNLVVEIEELSKKEDCILQKKYKLDKIAEIFEFIEKEKDKEKSEKSSPSTATPSKEPNEGKCDDFLEFDWN